MRAGFIAIVGLPNVGKSTLLNRLLGQKIAIASPKPQTTRNRILGVKNLPGAQLVLVDTPGLHRPHGRSKLNRYMLEEAQAAVAEVDALLVMLEAPSGADAKRIVERGYQGGREQEILVETLRTARKPAVVAINKIDLARDKRVMLPILEAWSKIEGVRALIPISATTGENEDQLVKELVEMVPEGAALFPEEMLTDRAERWLAAEMIREQVFLLTREEVPYAVAVTIDTFEERPQKKDVMIEATIHVEKEAQKRIVVGEGGRMVREIGSRARGEIGALLDCTVHLKLFVRVDPEWSERESGLRKMGYE
jgi:GTP-binding protein Era